MGRLVSISRAAKLVGVPRGTLQHRIQNGEIESFEGQVLLSDLARAYPNAQFDDNTMLEKIETIIENAARNARIRAVKVSPDLDTLVARVNVLSDELAEAKLEINNLQTVFDKLKSRLKNLVQSNPANADTLLQLQQWLLAELDNAQQQTIKQFSLLAADTLLSIMAAQVRLKPSGHEFLIEGNNSILESGLSSGLALNYGCSNGNCGKCKARVISGQVKKIRPHDYLLSEAEKLRGCILTCSYTAMTDVVLEADEATNVKDIPMQSISTWVRKITPLNDHMHIITLKTPRTQRLRFLAGQQVTLSIPDVGQRSFHVASCPCDDMNLQFHVFRNDADPLLNYFFEQLKANDTVQLDGPHGQFVLQEDAPNPIVFIALGQAFAPIKSLIEHAITLDVAHTLRLYWVAQDQQEIYQDNLCRSWTDALESFEYTPMVIAPGATPTPESLVQQIRKDFAEVGTVHFYIAGKADETASLQKTLIKSGANRQTIQVEVI